jgi:hypothetical protein
LRDASKGTHQERLTNALAQSQELCTEATQEFAKLGDKIERHLRELGVKESEIRAVEKALKHSELHNQSIRERMDEAEKTYTAKAAARKADTPTYVVSALVSATLAIFDPTATLGSMLAPIMASGTHIKGKRNTAKSRAESHQEHLEILRGQRAETETLQRLYETLPIVMTEIQKEAADTSILRDRTKMEAVAEAFLATYILKFGKTISDSLERRAGKHGLAGGLNALLKEFNPTSRLGEALENFCFGLADSNDLSVILTASNALPSPPTEPHERVLKEYVETIVKPNIADYCTHASKIDLIYQANLTGLGTHFHIHRQTIRGENDRHTSVLFADSFGVNNRMAEQSVQGAYDVKNVFQYYFHRHGGDDWLTDDQVQDGKGQRGVFGATMIEKRVNVLPDSAIQSHLKISKAARGVRQEGPEISDIFLRICGYDYFYPQSVNTADKHNIMTNNPAAPAAYVMANEVIKDFIGQMSLGSIGTYREQVGEKLDNLIAQSFMDFFEEIGREHAASTKILEMKVALKIEMDATGRYGSMLDEYAEKITGDALSRYDTFKDIYARNLEKTLEHATEQNRTLLEAQIAALSEESQKDLNPPVVKPQTHAAKLRAEQKNHSFSNTRIFGGGKSDGRR